MLLRHTSYNLIGLGAPLLVAIVSIPILIEGLGSDRFGLLVLIWAIVSYFGLFDLGLGRALTQQLARTFAGENSKDAGTIVATASVVMMGLGIFAGLILAAIAPYGVNLIHGVPDQREAIHSVYAMAIAMPAIVLTSAFRGVLEAKHAFGTVNLIRLPMGLFTFLGPVAVVVYGQPRLDWIAGLLAIGRVIACVVHAWYAWRILGNDRGSLRVRVALVKPLCVTGGWMTVSNLISPLMGYVDRFLIGAIVSVAAVTYYAIPHELVSKLWIVPGALTAVLFPTFAAQIVHRDKQASALFRQAVHWLYVFLLPVTLALALFAKEVLTLWISADFSHQSAILLQIFSVGILINCLAHVPFTFIQGVGKPKLTALIHIVEFPFFLGALWLLTSAYGILGTAFAWLARMVVDTLLMFIVSSPLLGRGVKKTLNPRVVALALLGVAAFAGVLLQSFPLRVWWLLIVTITVGLTLLPYKK